MSTEGQNRGVGLEGLEGRGICVCLEQEADVGWELEPW